jgi:hypothetical protein
MNEDIPKNIEPPLTVVYDDEGDPQEHADYYKVTHVGILDNGDQDVPLVSKNSGKKSKQVV